MKVLHAGYPCAERRGQPGCQNGMSYAGRVSILFPVVEQVSKTAVLRSWFGGVVFLSSLDWRGGAELLG